MLTSFPFWIQVLTASIYSSLRYSVARPYLGCIWNPPNPISWNTSISRSSTSLSNLLFHAQNGAPLYSFVGFLNSFISRTGSNHFLYSMLFSSDSYFYKDFNMNGRNKKCYILYPLFPKILRFHSLLIIVK